MTHEDDHIDTHTACALVGGNRPVHVSTLTRWVNARRISPPVQVGPNTVRFSRTQLLADLAALRRREVA